MSFMSICKGYSTVEYFANVGDNVYYEPKVSKEKLLTKTEFFTSSVKRISTTIA